MPVCRTLKHALFSLALLFLIPTAALPQRLAAPLQATSFSVPKYPNTKEGLKKLLNDMRKAAKRGDQFKLAALVKDLAIPNCYGWVHEMYDYDETESWMVECEQNIVESKGKAIKEDFIHTAKDHGRIVTWKVNDNPEPQKGFEWGWLRSIKQPLDIYAATWLPAGELKKYGPVPIGDGGYFTFVAGGFRWFSGIEEFKASEQNGADAKVIEQRLVNNVMPIYPPEAAAQHIVWTVRFCLVIDRSGALRDARAISGEGLSEDATLRKAAEDAFHDWRYSPKTFDGVPTHIKKVRSSPSCEVSVEKTRPTVASNNVNGFSGQYR